MSIAQIDNIFSQEELNQINDIIANSPTNVHEELGRRQFHSLAQAISPELEAKLTDIARKVSGLPLALAHAMAVEYNSIYGMSQIYTTLTTYIHILGLVRVLYTYT